MSRSNHLCFQKGMSLIELSLVLVVIGLLLGSGLTLLNLVQASSKIEAVRKDQKLLLTELQAWTIRHKQFICPDYDDDGEQDCQQLVLRGGELGKIPWVSLLKSANEMNIILSQERVAGMLYGIQPDLIGYLDPESTNSVIEYKEIYSEQSVQQASMGNRFKLKDAFCGVIANSSNNTDRPLKIKYDADSNCDSALNPLFVLVSPLDDLDSNNPENGTLDGSNSKDGHCLESHTAKLTPHYDDQINFSEYVTYLGGYCT